MRFRVYGLGRVWGLEDLGFGDIWSRVKGPSDAENFDPNKGPL